MPKRRVTWDEEKYGTVLAETVIDNVVAVMIIQQRDRTFLDIRKVHDRNLELRPGKGVRLEIDEGLAEDVMLVVQSMLMSIVFEDE